MNADQGDKEYLRKIIYIWSVISLIAITAALTFYFNEGYYELGEEKFRIYIRTAGFAIPVWIILRLVTLFRQGRKEDFISAVKEISATEWFILLLAVSGVISTLTSDFPEVSFLGFTGWHMGLAVQVLMIIGCFMASYLFAKGDRVLLYVTVSVVLIISAVAFILGVMNRFSIYPLHMWGQADDFISTLGNINWFCGYWSVWTGVGCGLYLYARNGYIKTILGIYVWICSVTGVCCGADSCYLAWGVISFATLIWALSTSDRMIRLCNMQILMFLSLPTVALIGALRPNRMWYDSAWLRGVCYENAWIMPFISAILFFSILTEVFRRRSLDLSGLRPLFAGACIGGMAAVIMIIILNSSIPGGIWPVRGRSLFTWSISWGSGRGGIWMVSMELIKSLFPFKIFFGVGCDCLCSYAYSSDEIAVRLTRYIGDQYLTNSHNEFLTMVIDQGILGTLAYFGMQISHMARCVRIIQHPETDTDTDDRSSVRGFIFGTLLATAAYIAVGVVGFMQILSTPFLFMLIGAASGLIKRLNINIMSIQWNENDT